MTKLRMSPTCVQAHLRAESTQSVAKSPSKSPPVPTKNLLARVFSLWSHPPDYRDGLDHALGSGNRCKEICKGNLNTVYMRMLCATSHRVTNNLHAQLAWFYTCFFKCSRHAFLQQRSPSGSLWTGTNYYLPDAPRQACKRPYGPGVSTPRSRKLSANAKVQMIES